MSLFAALTVAVGGLNAQSAAVGHISDNLANTQTTGYKRVDTSFESLVTQSNAFVNDPGGVRAKPSYTNSKQGNLVQSQSSTDLAISGAGFFAVRRPVVQADGTTTFTEEDLYTRRGDYTLDSEGYLVNGAGFYLSGYNVNGTTGIVDSSTWAPLRISQLLDNPVATSSLNYAANLPAGAVSGTTYPASTIQTYDGLGNQHTLSLTWTKTATTNQWTLNVAVPDATTPINNNLTFTFNDGTGGSLPGTINSIAAVLTGGPPATSPFTVVAPSAPDNYAYVDLPLSFTGAGGQSIRLDFGNYDVASGVTQFSDTSPQVTSLEQNGIPRGSFRDLSIDESGFVVLNYDNGRARTFFQVPIVQFFSPDSLQRVEGGAFSRTTDSGTPRFSAPGSVGAGQIVGNTLEGSNVDIADEFTKLIQAQRVYSANARTISTTNSMLDETINIVR